MAGRGDHFSLSEAEAEVLRGLADVEARVNYLHETIEQDYFENHPDRLVETDKAWDAMHRALTDGLLEWSGGDYPLTHVVLGGTNLGDDADVLVIKTVQQVRDVAAALPGITEKAFRARYDAIDPDSYEMPLSDEDFEYTWSNFEDVRVFWLRAADEGRNVLFSVGL